MQINSWLACLPSHMFRYVWVHEHCSCGNWGRLFRYTQLIRDKPGMWLKFAWISLCSPPNLIFLEVTIGRWSDGKESISLLCTPRALPDTITSLVIKDLVPWVLQVRGLKVISIEEVLRLMLSHSGRGTKNTVIPWTCHPVLQIGCGKMALQMALENTFNYLP